MPNFTIQRVIESGYTVGCTNFETNQYEGDTASLVSGSPLDGSIVWELNAGNNVMIPRAQKYGYDYFDNDILLGDLNNDQIINVLDIISTVNIVLGVDSYNPSGDMNQDGIINVLDIVSLVSIILGS